MSSVPPPPDRPTQPLRPIHPEPPPVVQERVVAPVADPNLLLRLEDTIDSLRTWLAILGLIAVVALGVAIYALMREDDGNSSGGSRSGLASDRRVSNLDDRVDRLSRQLQALRASGGSTGGNAGAGDNAALAGRVDALERTVKTLAARPATDSTQAIKDLSGRIDTLSRDVEQLKQAPTAP